MLIVTQSFWEKQVLPSAGCLIPIHSNTCPGALFLTNLANKAMISSLRNISYHRSALLAANGKEFPLVVAQSKPIRTCRQQHMRELDPEFSQYQKMRLSSAKAKVRHCRILIGRTVHCSPDSSERTPDSTSLVISFRANRITPYQILRELTLGLLWAFTTTSMAKIWSVQDKKVFITPSWLAPLFL